MQNYRRETARAVPFSSLSLRRGPGLGKRRVRTMI